jgi:hypothetical protein
MIPLRFLAFAITVLIFPSCRPEPEKCSCRPPPMPSQEELDSAFYNNTLQRRAIADIHSKPEGAIVSLDEMEIGTTPFDGIKLMPGMHKLEFELGDEFEMIFFDTTINFDSGKTRFSVDLQKVTHKKPR